MNRIGPSFFWRGSAEHRVMSEARREDRLDSVSESLQRTRRFSAAGMAGLVLLDGPKRTKRSSAAGRSARPTLRKRRAINSSRLRRDSDSIARSSLPPLRLTCGYLRRFAAPATFGYLRCFAASVQDADLPRGRPRAPLRGTHWMGGVSLGRSRRQAQLTPCMVSVPPTRATADVPVGIRRRLVRQGFWIYRIGF
jgi:hypothetical protein